MEWQLYRVAYELMSPLHIGYHKIGNVQRTRYYVPARNIWGAVTEKLTRGGFTAPGAPSGNYAEIGKWVRTHCAFSYWFLQAGTTILFPAMGEKDLRYGPLLESEFERRYIAAHLSTALDPTTTSAQAGSLHEIEVISEYDRDHRQRTSLSGWVFLDHDAITTLTDRGWKECMRKLWIGGERRYGFGRLRLSDDGWRPLENQQIAEGYRVSSNCGRPRIEIAAGKPFLAHTVATGTTASGLIEPVIGRETPESHQFGRKLTKALLCWVPGSICGESVYLEIGPDGIWQRPTT